MYTASAQCRVRQCLMCQGDTEYFCVSCPLDLCNQCKERHLQDLKTIDHTVEDYQEKFKYVQKQKICVLHPDRVYGNFCELCDRSGRFLCTDQRQYTTPYIKNETELQKQMQVIDIIRREALLYRHRLLTKIKADIKTCNKQFTFYQSKSLTKAMRLKAMMDRMLLNFQVKHRCLKEKMRMKCHISSIERYANSYEKSTVKPIKFLLSTKTSLCLMINLKLHTHKISLSILPKKKNFIESLFEIQITRCGKRRQKNERQLSMMPLPEMHHSFRVIGLRRCYHVSCMSSDRAWVSDDENKLVLTNKTGSNLDQVNDFYSEYGTHTVTDKNELIYIDMYHKVKRLSNCESTVATYIDKTHFVLWTPCCIYWSLTGDLLVGMHREIPSTGKVNRYNQVGQVAQTIQLDNKGIELYKKPNYITENNNGDIVVSQLGAVVVTERGGKHRFSYTGHPSGSGLSPWGICTDALSNILVCDSSTNTVQIIEKNGHFLSNLLIRPSGLFTPHSLSYDISTHRLWVGSRYTNKMCVYRYITDENTSTDPNIQEIPHEGKECLPKLMPGLELLQTITVSGVHHCFHITCATLDQVWVSDNGGNLVLMSTTGETQHSRVCLCRSVSNDGYGFHTISKECELIFIDKNYNVNTISEDLRTTTIFIKAEDSKWIPTCVFSSPITGSLLVGMYKKDTDAGRVSRFNHTRQLRQTVQFDNTGLEIYNKPHFITENNNGDIVVSDLSAVVVTKHDGTYRFSYTGHPSGSAVRLQGICTDEMSNILVCDAKTHTIQMIDKNGHFLSMLLKNSQEMQRPWSLGYDVNTHHLWVGSKFDNQVCVYKYEILKDALTEENPQCSEDA